MANVYKDLNILMASGQEAFKIHCERLVSQFSLLVSTSNTYSFPVHKLNLLVNHFLLIKGLPITTARPYHVLQAILRAQKRLNREFSHEEIEQGQVGPLLIAEDFDIDSYVSRSFYNYVTRP